jgi:hypothetical protein
LQRKKNGTVVERPGKNGCSFALRFLAYDERVRHLSYQLADLHGDVVAEASSSPTATAPTWTGAYDEFGRGARGGVAVGDGTRLAATLPLSVRYRLSVTLRRWEDLKGPSGSAPLPLPEVDPWRRTARLAAIAVLFATAVRCHLPLLTARRFMRRLGTARRIAPEDDQ